MARILIKPLLAEAVARDLPAYRPIPKSPGHWFGREADSVHEFFVCSFGMKSGRIEFDLFIGAFPNWNGHYGSHLLRAGLRLDNLRYNSSAVDVTKVGYTHNQTPESVAQAVSQGVEDLRRFALPYFSRFRAQLRSHPLIVTAFEWVAAQEDRIPSRVFDEIVDDRARRGYYHMEHPLWKDLLYRLRALNSPDRDEIPILALDLFQLLQENRNGLHRVAGLA